MENFYTQNCKEIMKKKRKAAVFVTSQDWDDNIVTTGDWLEEFELFEMELEFYNKMFQKVFVLIVRKSQKEDFKTLKEKISHLIQKVQLFKQKAHAHMQNINQFMQQNQNIKESQIIKERLNLEHDLQHFEKDLREFKKHLFKFTDQIVDNEKVLRFLKK
ncbi:MAG: hypothetical protein KatS3mg034_0921 [Vicingaceae bacterium]|nr:MAG: hypothetical protein KatS3mg034_0921 [Vicingaceae bacterium]